MTKTNIKPVIEYLPTTLIISYFFIHNIFLVLIGIIFSLYLININFINRLIRSIDKYLVSKKVSTELIKNEEVTKSNSIDTESNKEDIELSLVETIEELGFIPSIDNN